MTAIPSLVSLVLAAYKARLSTSSAGCLASRLILMNKSSEIKLSNTICREVTSLLWLQLSQHPSNQWKMVALLCDGEHRSLFDAACFLPQKRKNLPLQRSTLVSYDRIRDKYWRGRRQRTYNHDLLGKDFGVILSKHWGAKGMRTLVLLDTQPYPGIEYYSLKIQDGLTVHGYLSCNESRAFSVTRYPLPQAHRFGISNILFEVIARIACIV